MRYPKILTGRHRGLRTELMQRHKLVRMFWALCKWLHTKKALEQRWVGASADGHWQADIHTVTWEQFLDESWQIAIYKRKKELERLKAESWEQDSVELYQLRKQIRTETRWEILLEGAEQYIWCHKHNDGVVPDAMSGKSKYLYSFTGQAFEGSAHEAHLHPERVRQKEVQRKLWDQWLHYRTGETVEVQDNMYRAEVLYMTGIDTHQAFPSPYLPDGSGSFLGLPAERQKRIRRRKVKVDKEKLAIKEKIESAPFNPDDGLPSKVKRVYSDDYADDYSEVYAEFERSLGLDQAKSDDEEAVVVPEIASEAMIEKEYREKAAELKATKEAGFEELEDDAFLGSLDDGDDDN